MKKNQHLPENDLPESAGKYSVLTHKKVIGLKMFSADA
jgi:hypothetical protein